MKINRVRAQYSTGRVVETSYDGLNQPEVIAEGGRVTRYGYDLSGRAVILVAANGQTSQNSHDALGGGAEGPDVVQDGGDERDGGPRPI